MSALHDALTEYLATRRALGTRLGWPESCTCSPHHPDPHSRGEQALQVPHPWREPWTTAPPPPPPSANC